ncbi:MAG: hypothetical protein Q9160_006892 [Pyrenula sp. 1 TL-2023]
MLEGHNPRNEELLLVNGDNDAVPTITADTMGGKGREPLAIIGMSFSLPQSNDEESFWNLLRDRRSAMSTFPRSRFHADTFYNQNRKDSHYRFATRSAHFIDRDLASFDAPFFSISPAEAMEMDPQQRIFLETCFQALENSGVRLDRAIGSNTSVYTGNTSDDYRSMSTRDPENQGPYGATGVSQNMVANRASWFFNFTGASLNCDTACSSSLVAFHHACQGLWNHEADMSLIGGSNLIFGPEFMIGLSNLGFLSPDGRSFSFDHKANGFARGEGVAVLVVKRLADALRDNDTIRALIRETGLNQDGHTPSITQPSSRAQEALIRQTYKRAGLSLGETRFFEAHGTGTAVGDPLEAHAIASVFGPHRSDIDPLYVGAVKSNVGHLEGASGLAGLIKTVLVLEKGQIPPNAGFEKVNPNIDAKRWHLNFPTQPTPWPPGVRRASVNSFGFGGSNAHVIMDDAYHFLKSNGLGGHHCTINLHGVAQDRDTAKTNLRCNGEMHMNGHEGHAQPCSAACLNGSAKLNGFSTVRELTEDTGPNDASSTPKLLTFSAADEAGIDRISATYCQHMSEGDATQLTEDHLDRLAYTLNDRRSALTWRSCVVAESLKDLQRSGWKLPKAVRSITQPRLAFVFSGQGAQWARMGRELLAYDIFRKTLDEANAYFLRLGCRWSVLEELLREKKFSRISETAISQPMCTALQVALVDLLRSFGILPCAVLGHSSGEIAAAYAAGAIDKPSALRVAYFRGALVAERIVPGEGTMMAVGQSEANMRKYFLQVQKKLGSELQIGVGCINSPHSVTVTGKTDQIDMLEQILQEHDIFTRKIQVSVAYHSPYMSCISRDYLSKIGRVAAPAGTSPKEAICMLSSVSGSRIPHSDLCKADYWIENLVSPVRFSDALTNLCRPSASNANACQLLQPPNDILEIGPHSTLQGPTREILKAIKAPAIQYQSLLVRNVSARQSLLTTAGGLHCRGHTMSLSSVNEPSHPQARKPKAPLHNLPEYPFDHSRKYWREGRISENHRFRPHPRNTFLGVRATDWNPLEAKWRMMIRVEDNQWIDDHRIDGFLLYPAAGMIVMAIEAAKQLADPLRIVKGFVLEKVVFQNSLNVPEDADGIEVQIVLQSSDGASEKNVSGSAFRIFSFENKEWKVNCTGNIRLQYEEKHAGMENSFEFEKWKQQQRHVYHAGALRCSHSRHTKDVYDALKSAGMGFGPTFQSMENVRYSRKGDGLADLATRGWTRRQDEENVCEHVIHPATLDGLLQLPIPALSHGGEQLIPLVVPARMDRLWIANVDFSRQPTSKIKGYSKGAFTGFRKAEVSMLGLDASCEEVLVCIEGYEGIDVGSSKTAAAISEQDISRQLLFSFDKRPDVDLMKSKDMLDYCRDNALNPDAPATSQFYDDLRQANLLCVALTLQESGLKPENLPRHFQKYWVWMQDQMSKYQAGRLPYARPEWHTNFGSHDHLRTLCRKLEETNKTGLFYSKVITELPAILRGEVDAPGLFSESNQAENHYHEAGDTGADMVRFQVFLDAYAHKNPGMKVLEIGAGPGSTTGPVIQTLSKHNDNSTTPRFSHYDYTDISPAFFEKAQERFKGHANRMTFKTLNIDEDPIEQGFQEGMYDLILAGNVLHGTKQLGGSLAHARKLLKPGGKIAIFEVTEPDSMRTPFAFGLLDGWWSSTDDYRSVTPVVDEKKWQDVLQESGFSKIDVSLPDSDDPLCHEHSVIVATAIDKSAAAIEFPKTIVITEGESPAAYGLAQQLASKMLSLGAPDCAVLTAREAASLPNLQESFAVFLTEAERPVIGGLREDAFLDLRNLFSTLSGVLWITRGGGKTPENADFGMINGLARVVRSENRKTKFVTISFDHGTKINTATAIQQIADIYRNTVERAIDDFEPEYVEIDGHLSIDRLVTADRMNRIVASKVSGKRRDIKTFGSCPPVYLSIANPGLLDSLEFQDDHSVEKPLEATQIEVEVRASGVNFRDCLLALGRMSGTRFGFECAGVVTRVGHACTRFRPGDRVCAFLLGTFQTFVRAEEHLVMPVPENFSFAEGAALLTTTMVVYYGFFHVARIQRGETILIHSGAGATGQAAIQMAQHAGLEIFTTVGSEEKKQFLMDVYAIAEGHIFYSRNTSFADGVMRMTKGRGVDVCLNSLSGEQLFRSFECMAKFGRFLELGKKDILSHGRLPMGPFIRNVSFAALELSNALENHQSLLVEILAGVQSLVAEGRLRPAQPLHIYGISEIEKAFRYLQGGKNIGKVVVEMRKDDKFKTRLEVRPTFHFSPEASYVISGGLGGIGRSIARWMELQDRGVHVEAPASDITEIQSLSSVFARLGSSMQPIKGCINCTMLLRDCVFEQMSFESWEEALQAKVQGSWNLHTLLPPGMDFFIMLSSLTGVLGAPTQANYSCGNAYKDALCRHRVGLGEKATSLDLGVMVDDGVLVDNDKLRTALVSRGMMEITSKELNALLDYHCDPALPVTSPMETQVVVGLETPANLRAQGTDSGFWMSRPTFRHFHQIDGVTAGKGSASGPAQIDYASLLSKAESAADAAETVSQAIVQKLSKALAVSEDTFDLTKPMHNYGVDSLFAVELRNWFGKDMNADIAVFEILGDSSFVDVGKMIVSRSRYVPTKLKGEVS